jgi:hypothetical protein
MIWFAVGFIAKKGGSMITWNVLVWAPRTRDEVNNLVAQAGGTLHEKPPEYGLDGYPRVYVADGPEELKVHLESQDESVEARKKFF